MVKLRQAGSSSLHGGNTRITHTSHHTTRHDKSTRTHSTDRQVDHTHLQLHHTTPIHSCIHTNDSSEYSLGHLICRYRKHTHRPKHTHTHTHTHAHSFKTQRWREERERQGGQKGIRTARACNAFRRRRSCVRVTCVEGGSQNGVIMLA
mmetsp:Transcript_45545/g.113109  ORF Transcript_45545/g.113109 Transcript_45545/m.113109 type:complete len:149 (+) Transcript_45545:119-565(+)